MKSIGILIAMREELAPLTRHWKLDWTGPGNLWTGKVHGLRVQVALSGVGVQRARQAAHQLKNYGKPDWLVSLGYSGALQPHLRPGDAVWGSEVIAPDHTHHLAPDKTEVEKAITIWQTGQLLCSSTMVAKKEQHPEALAIDMESAAVAEAGLPWRALRVIVDDLRTELPLDFNRCLDSNGQTSPLKLAKEVARRPHRLPQLMKFAGHAQAAQRGLIAGADRLLESLTPWH